MASENFKESAGFKYLLAGLVLFVGVSCLPLVLRVIQIFSA